MPAQPPDRASYGLLGLRGKTIERGRRIRPALAFHAEQLDVVVGDVAVNSSLFRIDRVGRNGLNHRERHGDREKHSECFESFH